MIKRTMRLFSFLLTLSLVLQPSYASFALAQSDTEAPEISNVQIGSVSDTSVTITWETDEDADSLINYGLQEDYGIVRDPLVDKQSHSITLDELDPGRVYYFRVVSADEDGNQGISADYKVQTTGTPRAEGSGQSEAQGQGQGSQAGEGQSSETATVEEIKQQVQEITDPQQLQEILNEVVKAAAQAKVRGGVKMVAWLS